MKHTVPALLALATLTWSALLLGIAGPVSVQAQEQAGALGVSATLADGLPGVSEALQIGTLKVAMSRHPHRGKRHAHLRARSAGRCRASGCW